MVSGDLGKLSFWVEWFLKTSLISDEIYNNLEVKGLVTLNRLQINCLRIWLGTFRNHSK